MTTPTEAAYLAAKHRYEDAIKRDCGYQYRIRVHLEYLTTLSALRAEIGHRQ